MNKKKKVVIMTDWAGSSTGFSKHSRRLLEYLYNTNKYELINYATGIPYSCPETQRFPWKTIGCLPHTQQELDNYINQFPSDQRPVKHRDLGYGSMFIDKIIYDEKPDIICCIQDFWGFSFCIDKYWWNKINCMVHWTADSIPIFDEAIDKAEKLKYHYVWAQFAVNEIQNIIKKEAATLIQEQDIDKIKATQSKIQALSRIKCLRGIAATDSFYKFETQKRLELRRYHGITDDMFIVGGLSRNQLRKLWPNLIHGFKLFKEQNPKINAKLAFFTHFGEGWDIKRIAKYHGVDPKDILACYKCRKTKEFFILPYSGQDLDNPKTGDKGTLITVNVNDSLKIEQVNEWYNLLDCFCLPITSGGLEYGAAEAKLCELVTLINPYSAGEDLCDPKAQSLPLDYTTYYEIGTNFIKATVSPQSIADNLLKFYNFSSDKKQEMGKLARQWALDNFSASVIGKQYEEIFDSMPEVTWDFQPLDKDIKNPGFKLENQNFKTPEEFIYCLYSNILKMPDVTPEDAGFKSWIQRLAAGQNPQEIYQFFIETAQKHNQEIQSQFPSKEIASKVIDFEDFLDKTENKRLCVVVKESIGDVIMFTSLLKSIKQNYPAHDIYVFTKKECMEVFDGNSNVYKVLEYQPFMDSEIQMTGSGKNKGYFDVYINPNSQTQYFLNYLTQKNTKTI